MDNRGWERISIAGNVFVFFEIIPVELDQTIYGRQPDETKPVFQDVEDLRSGQAIFDAVFFKTQVLFLAHYEWGREKQGEKKEKNGAGKLVCQENPRLAKSPKRSMTNGFADGNMQLSRKIRAFDEGGIGKHRSTHLVY